MAANIVGHPCVLHMRPAFAPEISISGQNKLRALIRLLIASEDIDVFTNLDEPPVITKRPHIFDHIVSYLVCQWVKCMDRLRLPNAYEIGGLCQKGDVDSSLDTRDAHIVKVGTEGLKAEKELCIEIAGDRGPNTVFGNKPISYLFRASCKSLRWDNLVKIAFITLFIRNINYYFSIVGTGNPSVCHLGIDSVGIIQDRLINFSFASLLTQESVFCWCCSSMVYWACVSHLILFFYYLVYITCIYSKICGRKCSAGINL